MTPGIAQSVLWAVSGHLTIGALFSLLFVWRGVQALDPAARDMPLSVRLLLMPGAAALWPVLGWRWLRHKPPPVA
jgi:hypothetical protein